MFSASELPGSYQRIDRLIAHYTFIFLSFFPDGDSLCSCSWLRIRYQEDLAKKDTVRNRDTGLGLIETSQEIYIIQ